MRIIVDFDRALDHGFIQFGEGRSVSTTVLAPEAPDLEIHLDEDGFLVGIELHELGRRILSFAGDRLDSCELEDLRDR